MLIDKDAAESFVYPGIMRVLLQDIAAGYALNQCCGCPCLARITNVLPRFAFALKFARSHLGLKFCRASQSLRLVCAPLGWKRGRASVREA